MAKRGPHDVLGVDLDASATTIRAAWRRLAREHHPDLSGGDAQAARAATRQMVEINAAYEELRDPVRRRAAIDRARATRARSYGWGAAAAGGEAAEQAGAETSGTSAARTGRSGPPRPRPSRPVTARLDLSQTFKPRNQTITNAHRPFRVSNPPPRGDPTRAEPPRASDPTGPLRRARIRHFRPPPAPALSEALAKQIEFGKFRGHTLGEIAAFEPSYIDWIAGTITRDRELVTAARVIREDLDARGVTRARRPPRAGPSQVA